MVHEVYDEPGQRMLLMQYKTPEYSGADGVSGAGPTKTMYFYAEDAWVIENATGCFGGAISAIGHPMFGENGHMWGTKQFFDFAQEGQKEVYMGQTTVDGELCNHWKSIDDKSSVGSPFGSYQELDYYFAVATWADPGSEQEQVPVMLDLTGWFSYPGTGGRQDYHHYYIYSSIHNGSSPLGASGAGVNAFTVPDMMRDSCQGNITYLPPSAGPRCPINPSGDSTTTTTTSNTGGGSTPFTTTTTTAGPDAGNSTKCEDEKEGSVAGFVIYTLFVWLVASGVTYGIIACRRRSGRAMPASFSNPNFGMQNDDTTA